MTLFDQRVSVRCQITSRTRWSTAWVQLCIAWLLFGTGYSHAQPRPWTESSYAQLGGPLIPLGPHEVRLDGTIETLDAVHKTFVIRVFYVTQPNGAIDDVQARLATVHCTDTTSVRGSKAADPIKLGLSGRPVSWANYTPSDVISVIGTKGGAVDELQARLVLVVLHFDNPRDPTHQPNDRSPWAIPGPSGVAPAVAPSNVAEPASAPPILTPSHSVPPNAAPSRSVAAPSATNFAEGYPGHLNLRPRPNEVTSNLPYVEENEEDFSESSIGNWAAFVTDQATAKVQVETSRVAVGNQAIKFTTACGQDTGVRYPAGNNANWNLSQKKYLTFWTYAVNDHPWQGNQPVVVLRSPGGQFVYEPQTLLMHNKHWWQYWIPLDGDAQWTRTVVGTPDLARITQLEIHHDTFDYNFTVYYDGVNFVADKPALRPLPPDADPFVIAPKVLLIVIDPILRNGGGMRLHEARHWGNPFQLVTEMIGDLRRSSHDLVQYQIVETEIIDDYPGELDGSHYTDRSYDRAYERRRKKFVDVNLKALMDEYAVLEKVQDGDIDEVWFYTPPLGTPESIMVGQDAYFVNYAPARVPGQRNFVVMGLNFERGVAEAIHSYGHRTESIMKYIYGTNQRTGNTNWDKFTRLNKDKPGEGGVGNVHYPVNGSYDYDWKNPQPVLSNADDWYNYPFMQGSHRLVGMRDWMPREGDGSREYLNWWYDHIPHFTGRGVDGYLNNWWRYITDINQFINEHNTAHKSLDVPALVLSNPLRNAEVTGIVTVRAEAASAAPLGRVDIYLDGKLMASDSIAPFTCRWDTRKFNGDYTLQAKGYDLLTGSEVVADEIKVTVK